MGEHRLRKFIASLSGRLRHLSDESLLALIDARTSDPHLDGCPACSTRHAELLCLIADLDAVHAGADAAFDEERLLHQRQHILRRLERNNGPARVLPFPAAAAETSAAFHVIGASGRRWVAAAAIGGLLVGIFSGRFLTHRAAVPQQSSIQESRASGFGMPASGSVVPADHRRWLGEEVLLDEVEAAVAHPRIVELTAIDAITPAAR